MIHLLVDYENVNFLGLEGVEFLMSGDVVKIFYSDCCKTIPNHAIQTIIKSGCDYEIVKLKQPGRNALDFYIAMEVSTIFAFNPNANVAIVSRDKGFQTIRNYWKDRTEPENRLVVAKDIASCISASSEKMKRKHQVRKHYERKDLEVTFAEYKAQKAIIDLFIGTELEELTPQIAKLVEDNPEPKDLYLGSIKGFGKVKGLNVYRRLRGYGWADKSKLKCCVNE